MWWKACRPSSVLMLVYMTVASAIKSFALGGIFSPLSLFRRALEFLM